MSVVVVVVASIVTIVISSVVVVSIVIVIVIVPVVVVATSIVVITSPIVVVSTVVVLLTIVIIVVILTIVTSRIVSVPHAIILTPPVTEPISAVRLLQVHASSILEVLIVLVVIVIILNLVVVAVVFPCSIVIVTMSLIWTSPFLVVPVPESTCQVVTLTQIVSSLRTSKYASVLHNEWNQIIEAI